MNSGQASKRRLSRSKCAATSKDPCSLSNTCDNESSKLMLRARLIGTRCTARARSTRNNRQPQKGSAGRLTHFTCTHRKCAPTGPSRSRVIHGHCPIHGKVRTWTISDTPDVGMSICRHRRGTTDTQRPWLAFAPLQLRDGVVGGKPALLIGELPGAVRQIFELRQSAPGAVVDARC